MDTTTHLERLEVLHEAYNLGKRDNLAQVPELGAVFGIFGIVNEEPLNCRYIGEAENIRESIRLLFEHPGAVGLRKFMQGPWVKMLQWQLMPGSNKEERLRAAEEWTLRYRPGIDEDGEYPGYY